LISGIPKSTGETDTPVIPRLPAMSVPNELSLSSWVRLRLQFSARFSTTRDDQLWESPRLTL
jgi:hypothetical protein